VQVGPHNISMSLSWIALVAAVALVIWAGMLLNGSPISLKRSTAP
jgi:hypothetical protein